MCRLGRRCRLDSALLSPASPVSQQEGALIPQSPRPPWPPNGFRTEHKARMPRSPRTQRGVGGDYTNHTHANAAATPPRWSGLQVCLSRALAFWGRIRGREESTRGWRIGEESRRASIDWFGLFPTPNRRRVDLLSNKGAVQSGGKPSAGFWVERSMTRRLSSGERPPPRPVTPTRAAVEQMRVPWTHLGCI